MEQAGVRFFGASVMTIPPHLLEEARKIWREARRLWWAERYDDEDRSVEVVATALLSAEQRGREDAAKIVESRGQCGPKGEEWVDFPSRELAAAIRSRSEEPKP
jgi:hypothetical protein